MSPSCLGRGQTLVQPLWPLSATLEIVGSVRWFGTDGVSGAALLYSSFSGAYSEDSPGWSGLPAHHALFGLHRQGKGAGGAASTITCSGPWSPWCPALQRSDDRRARVRLH